MHPIAGQHSSTSIGSTQSWIPTIDCPFLSTRQAWRMSTSNKVMAMQRTATIGANRPCRCTSTAFVLAWSHSFLNSLAHWLFKCPLKPLSSLSVLIVWTSRKDWPMLAVICGCERLDMNCRTSAFSCRSLQTVSGHGQLPLLFDLTFFSGSVFSLRLPSNYCDEWSTSCPDRKVSFPDSELLDFPWAEINWPWSCMKWMFNILANTLE